MAIVCQTTDPRPPLTPGRSTADFHRPGRHWLHQVCEGFSFFVVHGRGMAVVHRTIDPRILASLTMPERTTSGLHRPGRWGGGRGGSRSDIFRPLSNVIFFPVTFSQSHLHATVQRCCFFAQPFRYLVFGRRSTSLFFFPSFFSLIRAGHRSVCLATPRLRPRCLLFVSSCALTGGNFLVALDLLSSSHAETRVSAIKLLSLMLVSQLSHWALSLLCLPRVGERVTGHAAWLIFLCLCSCRLGDSIATSPLSVTGTASTAITSYE